MRGKLIKKEEAIMEKTGSFNKPAEAVTWEEKSGLLDFLSRVHAEVARFDSTFDFGVGVLPSPPKSIDGSTEVLGNFGFLVLRRNSSLIGRDYCLYSVLKDRALHGYIGVYTGGSIETVRELKPVTGFREGAASLLVWLRELVRASCEKI
jgi:hypothetical protein